MPDENVTPAPAEEAGQVAESAVSQPQTAPQPQDGQVAEKQVEGTTEDGEREQREAFYQKKYQDMVKTHKGLSSQLEQYQEQYGELSTEQTPTQPNVGPTTDPVEYDFYTPEGQAMFADNITKNITENVGKMFAERDAQQKAQAQLQAEFNAAGSAFQKWATDNKIPEDVINEVYQQISRDLPNARPAVQFNYMAQAIINKTMLDSQSKFMADKVADATAKAKDLAGVAQPAPGTAPPVQPAQQKSFEQTLVDKWGKPKKSAADQLSDLK
jgi:hypothetical protein